MKHMIVPAEFKTEGDKGIVTGYASIFGNVDLGGDVISSEEPFKEFVKNSDGKVLMLYAHDSGSGWTSTGSGGMPIGAADVSQNTKGLKFEAQLVMEDPFVQRVFAHMKANTLSGMSVGYDVLAGGYKILESGIRQLTALKLWEISCCLWGMNPKAGIDTVKTAPKFDTIRECEIWLRDELDFTNSAAKDFIARFKKALVRDEPTRDESEAKAVEQNYLSFLNSLSKESQ